MEILSTMGANFIILLVAGIIGIGLGDFLYESNKKK